MFKCFRLRVSTARNTSSLRRCLSQLIQPSEIELVENSSQQIEDTLTKSLNSTTKKSLLEPLSNSEDISHISTYLQPTYPNFAAYANKSEILQELIKLDVNLHYIEKKLTDAVPFILKLNFEDIRDHILFLNQLGMKFEDIGQLITKNPFIFKERLEDLEVRINYLKFKKFDEAMILRIISKNPFWLSYSTQDIDKKLGFFQMNFKLAGHEVRLVATKKPQLITYEQEKVKLKMFVIRDEMGFNIEDMKEIILKTPKLFMSGQHRILKCFEYLHNEMGISHLQILEEPQILTCRENRLKARHQFLKKIGRDQFDSKKPNFVNLIEMVKNTDGIFAVQVAKSSAEEYNLFLKSM